MRYEQELLWTFIIALLVVYPVGASISMSGGQSISPSGGNGIQGTIVASSTGTGATTLASAIAGTGSMPYQSYSVSDDTIGSIRLTACVVGTASTKWSYNWATYKVPGSSVKGEQWLSASKATSFAANTVASNKDGSITATACISGSTPVSSVSTIVSNYHASGTATKTSESASQTFDSMSGLGIRATVFSSNQEKDNAKSDTYRMNDYTGIASFSGYSASAQVSNTFARADVYSLSANIPWGTISQSLTAMTPTLYSSVSSTLGGNAHIYVYPYDSKNWPSYAYASKSAVTSMQSVYEATGPYIQNGITYNGAATDSATAGKTGYSNVVKAISAQNQAIKVSNYASAGSGAPYASAAYLA